ncbi:uncharacterized protein ACA1_375950 [Acanthamoeba castellanii str. Neff]|uniref:Transmembrane protein n=1 Tax=Acanthamoeba castellanii (strain ATCC 30010 / Neff) TaxID=1257118 RepID=L8HHH9_ACACF|nr:uncharacterized protein ACA1_375950 [Acanthamoeba castellanii str. Neff]ELR24148.1 hypothetical protein ACA1_375950 [Acanthamoeba castellanii str. Neff]
MSHGAYSSLAREEGEVEGAVMLEEEEESCEHHHQLNSNSTGGRAVGPYRMCIVWCPIPVLTWMCPWVGHLGMSTSTGLLHDFAGPYTINTGHVKRLTRGGGLLWCQEVWGASPEEAAQKWDDAVEAASAEYANRMHNLLWDNCHSHVGYALNSLRFKRSTRWNTVTLILFMMLHSHYPSWRHVLQTYLPFLILLTFAALFFTFITA